MLYLKITCSITQKLWHRAHLHIDKISLIAALAVYAALTIPLLGTTSFWYDEAFSARIISLPLLEMIPLTVADVHPPLYYVLLKGWAAIGGASDIFLRLFSVVAGAAISVFGYAIVKRVDSKVAWLASIVLSVSPLLIWHATNARMYTLFAALIFAATYLLLRAQADNTKRTWILYGAVISAAILVHYGAVFYWAAHWIWQYVVQSDFLR